MTSVYLYNLRLTSVSITSANGRTAKFTKFSLISPASATSPFIIPFGIEKASAAKSIAIEIVSDMSPVVTAPLFVLVFVSTTLLILSPSSNGVIESVSDRIALKRFSYISSMMISASVTSCPSLSVLTTLLPNC